MPVQTRARASGFVARTRPRSALIISGAAARGPYAAGVLTRLAAHDGFDIQAVAGASSGALNAAVFAAGLRVGQAARAAEMLERLWLESANLSHILLWRWRRAIVREALAEFASGSTQAEVHLRVVVAALPGQQDRFGRLRFEQSYSYDALDFQDDARLDHMAELCVASAALPVLFRPRQVSGAGPFWDGGIVDNAPIGWALKTAPVDHIIVATSDSNQVHTRRYGRFSVSRLIQMLIDERLARDLHDAQSFNAELTRLDAKLDQVQRDSLRPSGQGFSGKGLALEVREQLNWRHLEFLEIRPEVELSGNILSGFYSRHHRQDYIEAGHAAADAALEAWDATTVSTAAASA